MGMGFRMWAHSGLPSGHLSLPPLERRGDALGAPDFGPWGAWRACADMLTAIYTWLDESGEMDVPIIFFSWGETATNYDLFRNIAMDELDAVGWSP